MKFNQKEFEVIKASIELRRKSEQDNLEINAELDDMLKRMSSPGINLKPIQRATLIGCVKDFLINPNSDLFKLSEFEILSSLENVKKRLEKVDVGLAIMNKLKRKKDKSFKRFEGTIQKIGELIQTQKVYYSKTDNGKIYKIGIITGGDKGIKLEADGTIIENFRILKLNEDSFMDSAPPKEVLIKLEEYGKENVLTENQKRIVKILKEACV